MTRFLLVLVALVVLCGLALMPLTSGEEPPNRAQPPVVGAPPALSLPRIERGTLSNGLAVRLVEAHEVPLVQVNLVLPVGSGDDPAGKYGLASLTSAMLDEGAGERSALELADQIEFLGASIATTSSFDASSVRLNVPVARLAEALPLLADVAIRPTFPQAELERLRQERLTALLQMRDDPAAIAPVAFARTVFGPAHRYGTAAVGTESTVEAFTAEDLRTFHAARYQPSGATVVVVGDTTLAQVMPLLERTFSSWRGAAAAAPRVALPAAPAPGGRRVWIVNVPGAAQSEIRIGGVGVPRSTPDYFPLQVLNTILGGSFTSRLNQNLREEHGYSYGAASRFDMRLAAGPVLAGAGVQTDKTAESLREFFNELDAIREPVGDEELAKSKNFIALGFPGEFESLGDLAARLEEMIVYGLPDTYFARYTDDIQAVSSAAVQAAARSYIRPDAFAVVVVGDAAVIEPGIRALNLGPVQVITVEEAVGR